MKKIIAVVLALALTVPHAAYALTDELLLADPVANTYNGRREATDMIANLSFADVAPGHWAKERITRSGAFGMLRGDNGLFNPGGNVSNQEALAFVVRAMGLENEAVQSAVSIRASLPVDSPARNLWSLGYLGVALSNGLITPEQYNDAIAPVQADNPTAFARAASATREQVAQWVYQAILALDSTAFDGASSMQSVFTFSDHQSISPDRVEAVEALAANNIMRGTDGRFNPQSDLTRAEMATLLSNIDQIYLDAVGLERKRGTVGVFVDGQANATGSVSLGRQFRIRTDSGSIDVLQYSLVSDSSPQSGVLDAVVYKDGAVGGLLSLAEGDQIEYIVNPATGLVYYVQVVDSGLSVRTVQGLLQAIDTSAPSVTVSDSSGKTFTYPIVAGLILEGRVFLSEVLRDTATLPFGSRVSLRLKNDVVDQISYLGEPALFMEMRGIVVENNPEFGYITFVDNDGFEVTRRYISGNMRVEKRPFYMTGDTVGYLSHMFPNFVYNPNEVLISDIEPGDIIFMRFAPDDPDNIISLSAASNYMMRYGRIRSFTVDGNSAGMMIEYENNQTAWFDLASGIPITKSGRMITAGNVMVGDWVRLLVNQAIIAPGVVLETVKEMTVEGTDSRMISNIVRGQLAGINTLQNQIIIQNAQTLERAGWSNYQNLSQFSLAGNDIEFFVNDQRVTLDYVDRYLTRSDGEVYIALENNFTGERVRRVTFRDGRDDLLEADVVVNTSGIGSFMITGSRETINTDAGTIVRRHGRLVEGVDIMAPDYAVVSLNGHNRAAVVDIQERPGTSGVQIVRGRVLSVDAGRSFRVQSMATLVNDSWAFTPVQREFTIDNQTLFLNEGGISSIDEFVGHGAESVIDRVFNIVVDGGRAARVVDAPYATASIRGRINTANENEVELLDVEYLDNATGRWSVISRIDASLNVTMAPNTIIAKENRVIAPSGLERGDYIRVMMSAPETPPTSGDTVQALIVRVDR